MYNIHLHVIHVTLFCCGCVCSPLRVQLNDSYCVHLLCYHEGAFVVSSEISRWFWGQDQLQGQLRKSKVNIWGLCLMRHSVPELFEAMADLDDTMLQSMGKMRSITVYSLEE